jgi:hypothetical protein
MFLLLSGVCFASAAPSPLSPPWAPPPPLSCPCRDASLCRPLAPQPAAVRDEIVAFSSWVFNEDHPSTLGPGVRSNYTAPELFDWGKIT